MTSSKKEFRRLIPALGTFVEVTLKIESDFENEVFSLIRKRVIELERTFSYFDVESDLSRYNRGERTVLSQDFQKTLALTKDLQIQSIGYFSPYRNGDPNQLDLSGIAKGAIADLLVKQVQAEFSIDEICINAGGDIRFSERQHYPAILKLGPPQNPKLRETFFPMPAIATSSRSLSVYDERSTTKYHLDSRFPSNWTVVVNASSCAIADAMTKIVLHAPEKVAKAVLGKYDAIAYIFDERAELMEAFDEVSPAV